MYQSKQTQSPKMHKKKRKRHQITKIKYETSTESLPGVTRFRLSEISQKILGIVVGHDVSIEKPWKFVKKEIILATIVEESEELLAVQEEVTGYPEEEFLVGYVMEDWFQLVHSVETKDYITEENDREQRELQESVWREIRRPVGKWEGLGSEMEIDENLVRYSRPLIEINLTISKIKRPNKLSLRRVNDVRDGYVEILPVEPVETVERARIDGASQTCSKFVSTSAQTTKLCQKNINTQYELPIQKTSRLMLLEQQLETVSDTNVKLLNDAIWLNNHHNIYVDDYAKLAKSPAERLNVLSKFQILRCYMCPELVGRNMVRQISWDNFTSGLLAVCYNTISMTAKKRSGAFESESKEDMVACPVLVWSYDNSFEPVSTLGTPRTVTTLSFSPYRRCLLVGGCVNGQILVWDFLEDLEKKPEWTGSNLNVKTFKLMASRIGLVVPKTTKAVFTSELKTSHSGLISGISWLPHDLVMRQNGKLGRKTYNDNTSQFLTTSFDGTVLVWSLEKISKGKKKGRFFATKSSPIEVSLIHKIIVNVPLLTHARKFTTLKYDEVSPNRDPTVRSIFKISESQPPSTNYPLIFTSTTGNIIEISWPERDFDTGQKVPIEKASVTNFTTVHDGPIAHCCVHTFFHEAVLSIGGTVFALWHVAFPYPLFWRKCSHGCYYICGGFSAYSSLYLILARSDGVLELWDLHNMKCPVKEMYVDTNFLMMSEGFFTAAHCRKNTFALSDSLGTLMIMRIPKDLLGSSNEEEARDILKNLLDYKTYVKDLLTRLEKVSKPKEEEEIPEEFTKVVELEDQVVEKPKFADEDYMKKILLARKNLNIYDMEKLRKPLAELHVEAVQREKRKAKAVSYKTKISTQIMSKVFQGIVSPPRHVDYNRYSMTSAKYLNKYVVERVDEYAELESRILDFVDVNAYEVEFNWNSYVENGKKRKWWKGF